jgi:hypothetical protein
LNYKKGDIVWVEFNPTDGDNDQSCSGFYRIKNVCAEKKEYPYGLKGLDESLKYPAFFRNQGVDDFCSALEIKYKFVANKLLKLVF